MGPIHQVRGGGRNVLDDAHVLQLRDSYAAVVEQLQSCGHPERLHDAATNAVKTKKDLKYTNRNIWFLVVSKNTHR